MTTGLLPFAPRLCIAFSLLMATAGPAAGDEGKFDVNPWIEDLHEIRSAMSEKYANFEWAVFEREVNLSELFDETESRLRGTVSDEDAKATIDRSLRSIGDGHLRVRWPTLPASVPIPGPMTQSDVCSTLGYDVVKSGQALGQQSRGHHRCAHSRCRLWSHKRRHPDDTHA